MIVKDYRVGTGQIDDRRGPQGFDTGLFGNNRGEHGGVRLVGENRGLQGGVQVW